MKRVQAIILLYDKVVMTLSVNSCSADRCPWQVKINKRILGEGIWHCYRRTHSQKRARCIGPSTSELSKQLYASMAIAGGATHTPYRLRRAVLLLWLNTACSAEK